MTKKIKNKKDKFLEEILIDKENETEKLREDIFKITNDKDLISNEQLLNIIVYWEGLDYLYEMFRDNINAYEDEKGLSDLKNYLIRNYLLNNQKK